MSAPSPTISPASTGDLVLLGPIVLLQVQIAPLKQGEKPLRWYAPDAITSVSEMQLDSGGVTGFDGETVKHDVHHRDHPLSRYRGENGVSVGFTSHYATIRGEFGDFLYDGIAGENLPDSQQLGVHRGCVHGWRRHHDRGRPGGADSGGGRAAVR
ncbi:MAG: hypothetical protein QM753_17660 [Thermomicrobiales bacterium]